MSNAQGHQKIQVNRFQILFTKKRLTAYGGFSLLAKFFVKIALRAFFEQAVPIVETSPNALGRHKLANHGFGDMNVLHQRLHYHARNLQNQQQLLWSCIEATPLALRKP